MQHDSTDCAAACIAMICFYYGKSTSISKIRDVAGTDIKGSTLLGVENALKGLGFESRSVRVDKNNFKSKFTLPAIAHVVTNEGLAHFVVVRKIKDDYVWISDPAKGNRKLTVDSFFETFDGVLVLMVPNSDFVKCNDKHKNTFNYFLKLINSQRKLFVYAIISSFVLTVLGIFSSFFNKFLMDEIIPYNLKNDLKVYVMVFALIAATQLFISFVRSQLLLYLSQKIDIPLILGYFKHVFLLPMKFFSTRTTGDILTRFSDSFTIKNVITEIYLTIVIDVFMATVSAIILYTMNAKLFVIVIILALFDAILVYGFKPSYKKINLESMEQSSRLNSSIIETLKGVETIKANANEERVLEKLENEYIKGMRINFKQGMLTNTQSLIGSVISVFGNLVLMYVGSSAVMNGDITLGTLLSFLSLSVFFMDPIGRFVKVQLSLQEANISMKRISEILEVEEEQEVSSGDLELDSITEDVVFENVVFRYGYREPVLKNVSLRIPKGKKVALVGESGCGKTTISKLILNFFSPESGRVLINGRDVKEFTVKTLRENVSYVSQSVELFSGSLIENLRIGNPNSTTKEIKEVCSMIGCDKFINRLPSRYKTFLSEAGESLSGGERQRIAIARALLKKNDFLILDEATSNLDFLSEAQVYDVIFNKLHDVTTLIIAHRLSMVKDCDLIYVLEEGEVKEHGTHDELLSKKGLYFKLWNGNSSNESFHPKDDSLLVCEDDENVMTY